MEAKARQILQSVRELVLRYGLKSLTMDDISRHMGMSKKTLYQYFDNKADLVDKMVEFSINMRTRMLEELLEQGGNAIDLMLNIFRQNIQMSGSMNPALMFEMKKYFKPTYDKVEAFRKDVITRIVEENLEEGVKTGLYRSDINIQMIATLYSIRMLDLLDPKLFPRTEFNFEEIMHQVFLYHIRGVASPKGIEYLENNVGLDF